ncbi:MAG: ABC transporter ATP-binding protein [Actinomycetota bacterium]
MPAVEVRELSKRYGSIEAVRGISFEVGEGEVFSLLGPNGAGKTTTVEILEGYRRRDEGTVSVLGHDPSRGERALKERIGIVLQQTGVEEFLTVRETIEMYRGYYPHPRPTEEIIELVELGPKAETRITKLSGGQRRRLDVAIALSGDPDLLFLDEPTTGFDPAARRNAWTVVKNLADLGKTILLTTHYMDEAQFLADRVAIIRDGEIVAEGPPSTLAGRETAATRIRFRTTAGAVPPPIAGVEAKVVDGTAELRTERPTQVLHELTTWAVDAGRELEGLEVSRPSLEDVYLELTGGDRPAREEEPAPAGRRGRRRR